MSSLSAILNAASSGMYAAQTGLGVVSDNISNLNTAGYVRKVLDQNSQAVGGVGTGVSVTGVTRAANQFLQNASLSAAADAGSAGAVADLLNQAQALFGDPSSSTSYLNQLNQVFSDFAATANDPASGINSTQAVDDVSQFLSQSQSIAGSLNQLTTQADSRIDSDVDQANQLLSQIASLNTQIVKASSIGADATDPQNTQSQLINQLSSLMNINVASGQNGSVVIRSGAGATLVGIGGAATLGYQASTSATSQMVITQPGGGGQSTPLTISSGELSGLLSLRNTQLPGIADQLSSFVSGAVTALNQAHNASSAVPPPTTLTGRNTGLDLPTAVSNFTGKTSVAIVNASGQVQQQVDIDFDAGTMTVGGTATSFTPSTFLSTLNGALGGAGGASFSNGALSISATAGSGNGVAIGDDATTPSAKVGQGQSFSQFFGLNDLVTSTGVTNFHTGLQPGDPNGFTPGSTITLRLSDTTGSQITDVQVAVPAGGTMQNLVDALNANVGGVGLYGQFTLDSTGMLSFNSNTPGTSLSVVNDQTQRGVGGPTMTQLFGLGSAQQADSTTSYQVRADIAADPTNLATATLNLNAGAGQPVLAIGDGSGALRLSQAGQTSVQFDAAGGLASATSTVTRYAAQLGGTLGNQAAAATQAQTSAQSVQTEADSRRQSVEGVNLDEELVNLTTYQQAYSANARLVTATSDMFTTLLNMVQ